METTSGVRSHSDSCNHCKVKIPPFMRNIKIWFTQVENSFKLARITSESTKFQYLICNLPAEILEEYEALLDDSCDSSYSNLKNALLEKYQITPQDATQKFWNIQSLEGKSPSTALRELQTLIKCFDKNADLETNILLRNRFESIMPADIKIPLLCKDFQTLTEMAKFADKLIRISNDKTFNLFKVQHNAFNEIKDNENHEVKLEQSNQFCFYHRKFGKKAIKCQSPCNWNEINSGNGQKKQ